MPASRRCPKCPRLIPAGTRYCPEHTAQYEASRGTPTTRGYGPAHQRERAKWKARITRGDTVTCTRCGQPIPPDAPWDLGHTPDRTTWTGPEHANCNRSDGGKRAHT